MGNVTNVSVFFMRYPDWVPAFDIDGPALTETRRRLVERATDEHLLVAGQEHVARDGEEFAFVPAL